MATTHPGDQDALRSILELLADYVFVVEVDAHGQPVERWEDRPFSELIGGVPDEPRPPGTFSQHVHPDDLARYWQRRARVQAGERDVSEFRVRTAAGESRWLRVSTQPVWDEALGRVVRFYGAAQDVTERRLAEDEIRTRAAQQAAVAELGLRALGTDDVTTLLREAVALAARTLRAEFASVLERLPGANGLQIRAAVGWHEDLVGHIVPDDPDSLATFTVRSNGPVIVQNLASAGRFPASSILHRHRVDSGMAVAITGLEGPFGVLTVMSASPRIFSGNDVHFLQSLANVLAAAIERQRNATTLQEHERLLRTIIEAEPECVKLTTRDAVLLAMNPAGLAMIEADSLDQVLGQSILTWVVPAYHAAYGALLDRVFDGESGQLEFELVGLKGTQRWLEMHAVPLRGPAGDIVAALGVSRDITEHRRAEAALRSSEERLRQAQKLEAIGLLAGGVAHDFNNLLTAIIGFSDLLGAQLESNDPRRAMVQQISTAAERAATLTGQLLAFSRRQPQRLEALDLNQVVADMERLLRPIIGEDIALSTVLDPELGVIQADRGQIEQVIMNLAVNARDAMPDGGQLTIVTANQVRAAPNAEGATGRVALLTISDTGVGMDTATRARAFEPFFTTKGRGKGTGLGLATVYGIIMQSGGDIEVFSELGKGSTFRIALPTVERAAAAPAAAPPHLPPSPGSHAGTILLVEDEAGVRALAERVLELHGYTLLVASSGEAALHLVETDPRPIDLVLTDVVMPGMSGPELARRVAELRPALRILFISGYPGDVAARHGVPGGAAAILAKPFTPRTLLDRVRAALDSRG